MRLKFNLAFKITAGLTLIILLTCGILLWNIIRVSDRTLVREGLEKQAQNTLAIMDLAISAGLKELRMTADELAKKESVSAALSTGRLDAQLAHSLRGTLSPDHLDCIIITDRKGKVYARAHNPRKYGDQSSRDPYVRKALDGVTTGGIELAQRQGLFEDMFKHRGIAGRDAMLLRATVPIADKLHHQVIGTATVAKFLNDNMPFINKMKELGRGEVALYGKDGGVIAASCPGLTKNNGRFFAADKCLQNSQAQDIGLLSVFISKAPFIQARDTLLRDTLILFSAIALLIIVLSVFFIHRIATSPIQRFISGMSKIENDDLSYRMDINGGDEIAALARSFNTMTENLQKTTVSRDSLILEIAERKKAEQRLADIINFLPDATFVIDRKGKVIAWNKAVEELCGVPAENMLGKGNHEHSLPFYGERRPILIDAVLHCDPEFDRRYLYIEKKQDILIAENLLPNVRGKSIYVWAKAAPLYDAAGQVIGAIETVRDITERKIAEEELQKAYQDLAVAQAYVVQSEKMAAVGQLAGGIAHEINNPLGVILGFSQSVLRKVPESDPVFMPLKYIEEQATRCKHLVQDLLTFSRVEKTKKDICDLNTVINAALGLIATKTKIANIELIKEFSEHLPPISGNANRIQQAIINLCNNAIDALPRGGKLTVRTLPAEQGVEIQVQDTGSGIPPEIQSRIFEPFFTTKESGHGTGLGLALVYEIVKDHEGRIELESETGKGTLFRITLPLSPRSPADPGATAA